MFWSEPHGESVEEAVRCQIFNMLFVVFACDTLVSSQKWAGFSEKEVVAGFIGLEVLNRELVLSLCRLGEEKPDTMSLYRLRNERSTELDQMTLRRIKEVLNCLKKGIDPWRREIRNKRIAHHLEISPENHGQLEELRTLAGLAVQAFDYMSEARREFLFRFRNSSPLTDLRQFVETGRGGAG